MATLEAVVLAPASRLTPAVVALMAALAALSSLSTNIILPSFPTIGAALGVSTRELGVTLSSFFVAFALGQLVVGPLSDRYGRRMLVVGGLLVFIIGSALAARADSLAMLVAGRVVQALGVCAASVLSRAIARDLFEGDALARALSFTMVAMAAAPGFSPLLGTAIDGALGWRAAFVIVGLAGGVVAVLYLAVIGETHPASRRVSASVRGTARAYMTLLGDRRFIAPALGVGCVIGALFAFFAAAPAILLDHLGLRPLALSLFFAATVFVVFGSGLLAPRLARRFGAARVAFAGGLVALLGAAMMLAAGAGLGLGWLSVSLTVFLFGMGTANPLGTAVALQPFGERAGLASALVGFVQMSCAAVASSAATLLPLAAPVALSATLVACTAIGSLMYFLRLTAPQAAQP